NRYFDREIDAGNPRTARRATASGALSPNVMIGAMIAGLSLLVLAAARLNPVCVRLLPLATVGVLLYPLCKRFTWLAHFVLGAVDALAPLGAYIAVAGNVGLPGVLLFVAVAVWVAGFDILYALMDIEIDRSQNLRSIPAHFGRRKGELLALVLHGVMIVTLFAAGTLAHAGLPYFAGIVLALALLLYEGRLLQVAKNFFVLNQRIFITNMAFSVAFLATTLAGFTLR
ncbi:MAG: putative 4-hydroxybenzoate polyprenyltransferase, partial [Candidatus Eremiobacteraeota bacterium]|nr:putative 4-hydroxybenzoate polyprenyltransferase [Candidatus Eremiobacteraeota bacterium]